MSVLVTGASGFVGSHVLERLAGRAGTEVRVGVHRSAPRARPGVRTVPLDLLDAESVRAAVRGVDVVVHLASRVSGTPEAVHAVNAVGTQRLVRECVRAGVGRIVRLSTAAVYGRAPRAGAAVSQLRPDPESATSRSRLIGDQAVLDAGGLVVRPHLVHGAGDRWFTPRALDITRRTGLIDGGAARHSLIDVGTLAAGIVACALADTAPAGVLLAGPSQPVTVRTFLDGLGGSPSETPADGSLLADALDHPAGRADPRWRTDVALLGRDHFYDCAEFASWAA